MFQQYSHLEPMDPSLFFSCPSPVPSPPTPSLYDPPSNSVNKAYPPHKYVAVAAQAVYTCTPNNTPIVARVSLTDYRGNVLLDSLVRPTESIVDFRFLETGLQPVFFINAPTFQDVQRKAAGLIENKIIIGHTLWHFLSVLSLSHPALDTRDLALFLPFRRKMQCKTMILLPDLVRFFMGRDIGLQYENPLECARASIDLFRSCEGLWEAIVRAGSWPCLLPPSSYSESFY